MAYCLEKIAAALTDGRARAVAIEWSALRFEHAAALRARFAEELAPASANLILSALRGVLKAARDLGQLDSQNYVRIQSVKPIRGERLPKGRALLLAELRALLEECSADETTTAGARDAALLATMYATGLRRSELVSIQLEDLDRIQWSLRVRAGKGRKERLVYLSDGADRAVDAWLEHRGLWDGALFCPVHRSGRIARRGMTDQALVYILRKRADQARVRRFSPHDLRRTFISDLLDAGADLAAAQQLAGHASPTTTSRYDRRGEAAKKRAANLLRVPYRATGGRLR
jgi:integrase/recombinase XerD